jgi:two-component system response regulator PhoP
MNSVLAVSPAKESRPLRVAVLEDDQELRERILIPGLEDFGFEVTGSGTAAELYRRMLSTRFDIVVLDIGLPDEDGLTVARHLREIMPIGIVMLTGNRGRQDHIRALHEGADAFLCKPVDVEVLAGTLHSLARRLKSTLTAAGLPAEASDALVNRWHLDTDDWCLIAPDATTIALSVPERCVLQVLFAAHGVTVPRETLIAALSRDIYEFDPHRLEMLIYRLRRKAATQGVPALPLLTVRGSGYVFVA